MLGVVAAVVHIDSPHFHAANVGDCQVVVRILAGKCFVFYKMYITK